MTATGRLEDDRLRALVLYAIPDRELVMSVSRRDTRRLARQIQLSNCHGDDYQLDAGDPIDLGIIAAECMLRGLDASDEDEGVWSDVEGVARSLPRPNRSPWRKRLKYAVEAARVTWRST